ncbi:lipopolysaccharide biosynthesis protein [Marinobacter subterrani]|uniref:Membrane protein involved in the export of O-antigen and teichoic acid n=1 Tax=Marinobacter subterrani TaxID=1658765 RepID=A0A0J7J819_9GAMM|nr:lipopolysaccharide biosynthesis protein [Marinobacter subterrani]KMQ74613.1 Membrane protein involved in the export of O-antigen and teichoic acid [Marinobacter subterrani]
MSEYKNRVVNAVAISGGSRVVIQLVSLGYTITLARLLTPDDFGLITMVAVFTGFAGLLADVGLGSALIQKKDVTELDYSTVFWTNLGLGLFFTGLIFISSDWIAAFYQREELSLIAKILSLQFVLDAIRLVPGNRLARELHFGYVAIANLLGMLCAGALAVYMAVVGYGFWALAWQAVASSVVTTLVICLSCRWIPRLAFSFSALKGLVNFSMYVFGTQMIQYGARTVDKLLAGRYLGSDAVGILGRAQTLLLLPLKNISHVVGNVMFPALSMVQDDVARVRRVYLRSTQAIALATFPMMLGMMAVADNFVVGVLGEQWAAMIPIIRILSIAGIASSIVTITGSVYLSQGASKLQFRVNLVTRPIAILGVVIGLPWGLVGIATGSLVAVLINTQITLSRAGSLIGLRLLDFFRALLPTLIAASLMAVPVFLIGFYLDLEKPLVELLIQVLAGVVLYIGLAIGMKLPALTDLHGLVKSRIKRKAGSEKSS